MNAMETYNGHVRTPADAIILFEACRIGLLPRVQRRLSKKERQSIKSGSVFVWDEREAGMRRWTDGKSWSASRVSGSFLTYREMEGKRGGNSFDKTANRDGIAGAGADPDSDGGGPDGYRYKPDGLMKQSFSITTNSGQHLHLISYFSRSQAAGQGLLQPSNDPQLRHIRPEKGMYPDSTVHEQSTIPAVTRGPMASPGYTHAPNQQSAYNRGGPYAFAPHSGWAPPSPMHTPPPHYPPYYQGHHPGGYPGHPGQSSLQNMQYPGPHGAYGHPQGMTPYDRPPPPLSHHGLPPPPPHQQQYAPNGYPGPYGYGAQYGQYQQPYPPHPQQHPQQYDPRLQAPPPPAQLPPANLPPANLPSSQLAPANLPPARVPEARKDSESAESRQAQPTVPSTTPQESTQTQTSAETQTVAGASATTASTSAQTIPSISAMLNGGASGEPPQRTSSRSPNGTPVARPLQDIPMSKLGFEASRDVQTLRNLDKSTFKY